MTRDPFINAKGMTAAEFCQKVVRDALWGDDGAWEHPYGITGCSTGGAGGPEAAAWMSFEVGGGGEEFIVEVRKRDDETVIPTSRAVSPPEGLAWSGLMGVNLVGSVLHWSPRLAAQTGNPADGLMLEDDGKLYRHRWGHWDAVSGEVPDDATRIS